ncbi:glycosyltransferase family 2 protein [Rubrimonas sp.]|uniref:glycosyltransferase family 2 protein n=1 Tax=Rubrimonas sp. TaxID=2036015 RepID=UPI002FDCAEB0
MSDAPAVTVALSAKDNAAFLPQAMDTLLAQSFRDFELITVDDGSADATWDILQAYAARDARVIPLRNARNIGLAASLNRILAEARAPLIARADGDDVYHPDRLARQVAFMAATPRVGVLSCGYRRIDATGAVLEVKRPVTGWGRVRMHMFFDNPILHPGAMMRTATVRAVDGYDESYRVSQDTDLWARLFAATRFDNLPDPLVDWRAHGAASMKDRDPARWMPGHNVRRRMLGEYYGGEVELEEALSVMRLFRGYDQEPPTTHVDAERALTRLFRRALLREPLSGLRHLCGVVSVRLAQKAAEAPRAEARRLYAASLRWRPSRAAAAGLARAALGG